MDTRINNFIMTGPLHRVWQTSYAADYLGFILLLVLYLLVQFLVTPFHRMFTLSNIDIQYPHAEVERVSVGWLFVYAGGIPLVLLALWAGVIRPGIHKAHVTILGLFVSLILTSFITNIIKNAVGRPRPDLLARCKPEKGTPLYSLVTIDICTETAHHLLQDGWRSFPSGHSSFAFGGLGFLAIVLAGQLHVFHPRTDLARVLVVLVPLIGALLIAISRCEDYRHDVWDVCTGSIIGSLVAYVTYRRYYPPLSSAGCDTPFSDPAFSEVNQRNGYSGLRDVEGGFMDEGRDRIPLQDVGMKQGRV